MLVVLFAFQNPNRLVDGNAPLDHRGIRRRSHDLTAANSLIDAWSKVVGRDLDLIGQAPRTKDRYGGFSGHRRADDIFQIGMRFERISLRLAPIT